MALIWEKLEYEDDSVVLHDFFSANDFVLSNAVELACAVEPVLPKHISTKLTSRRG
jgi:hypothetical protein